MGASNPSSDSESNAGLRSKVRRAWLVDVGRCCCRSEDVDAIDISTSSLLDISTSSSEGRPKARLRFMGRRARPDFRGLSPSSLDERNILSEGESRTGSEATYG